MRLAAGRSSRGGILPVVANRAEAVNHPIQVTGPVGGHDGDDSRLAEAGDVAGLDHLIVRRARAAVAGAVPGRHLLDAVERLMDCGIAYGMDTL
jgi:hypothetical protein